jgi:hypothetical protein
MKLRYAYLVAFVVCQATGALLMIRMNVHGPSALASTVLLLPGSAVDWPEDISDRLFLPSVLAVNAVAWGLPVLIVFVIARRWLLEQGSITQPARKPLRAFRVFRGRVLTANHEKHERREIRR